MDLDTLNAQLPLEFRLGSRLVVAKKAELLHKSRRNVCRLELTQPLFLTLIQPIMGFLCPWIKARWPEWFLPPAVILKKPKPGWEVQYNTEKEAYRHLRPLQGTVIPYFYGEAKGYGGSDALVFSAIAGSNLLHLALNKFPESKDEVLKKSLEDAFKALTSYGVEYEDDELYNILWVDKDERVMVIDLEQVKFDVWDEDRNSVTAASLMSEFMETRNPELRNEYNYWVINPVDCSDQ